MLIRHDFVNLLDEFPGKGDSNHPRGDAFPVEKALESASLLWPKLRGRHVVLLGRNVMNAFKLNIDWFTWVQIEAAWFAACPHPIGGIALVDKREQQGESHQFLQKYSIQIKKGG